MVLSATLLAFAFSASARAAAPAAFPLYDGSGGATCDFFNLQARIRWSRRLGDWIDAAGTAHGNAPFARASVTDTGRDHPVDWDVTGLVQQWLDGKLPAEGLLLRPAPGGPAGAARFLSRESAVPESRPRLEIEFADGRRESLQALADTHLQCSTYYSQGQLRVLSADAQSNLLVHFDVAPLRGAGTVRKATLTLTAAAKQYGSTQIGVYRLAVPPRDVAAAPESGLAARYPGDRGIERDPDVIMATGFDSLAWSAEWSHVRGSYERVTQPGAAGFAPLAGAALAVTIPQGRNLGLDMSYKFGAKSGAEPEEVYFRYYLRLGSDWDPADEGGKLPGIAGTYGQAGWGGRRSDGTDGWSIRGGFARRPEPGNPYRDLTTIGSYVYHPDAGDLWGDDWPWTAYQRGLLERNRWYCIEQYVKLNRPGAKDAVFRAWVDGRLAFERTGFRLREVPAVRIEQVWMNVYFGGTRPSPRDQHLFIDNVVIAKRYVGPLAGP